MRDILATVPLVGWGPQIVLAAIAIVLLVVAVLLWRRHKVWRWFCVFGFVVFGVSTAAAVVNTQFSYFDTLADLAGIPSYPTADGTQVPTDVAQPNGLVISMPVPDTRSHFGTYDAKVWLPPQYFTDHRKHFPVLIFAHGNPGANDSWLTAGGAAAAGLSVAQSGQPVIMVFPTVLQNNLTGDSLCVDTQSEGNAETYITQDVIAAVDTRLRTVTNAKGRAIGGNSMGGFCALNLSLKHPDLFSTAIDLAGDVTSSPDVIDGGNQALYGGADWQQRAAANSPDQYYSRLDPSKGPALWMDVGDDDVRKGKTQKLASALKSKGFTVEFHSRPGGHGFATWSAGFKEALPWAAKRMTP